MICPQEHIHLLRQKNTTENDKKRKKRNQESFYSFCSSVFLLFCFKAITQHKCVFDCVFHVFVSRTRLVWSAQSSTLSTWTRLPMWRPPRISVEVCKYFPLSPLWETKMAARRLQGVFWWQRETWGLPIYGGVLHDVFMNLLLLL